ncbi:phospholipid-transporting ATPase ABCA3-like [Penaeus chinensis]|uniref:phospholipid-transporting ATPase ABCA3-like n=1 Tax=Penaeus chinensis TaxID=139456 RepID=UPI001FB59DED|nr:phospholipid-transporting ATPase ABCA3-like [Penaeus chinensis]XP_047474331.1 phospholipid-transporting ATPase ABCA3-like [Penaeus chinensis]XP_047474332.1 phospholipid-transporting ATPase ABCA3-like [Penaeus chinensis]
MTSVMNLSTPEARDSVDAWNNDSSSGNGATEEGNFWYQYKALIIRNFTIKARDRRRTITEFLMPLYWIAILAIVRLTTGSTTFDPVLTPQGTGSLTEILAARLNGGTLFVTPENDKVKEIMDNVQHIATEYSTSLYTQYYSTETDLVDEFKQNMSVDAAIVFPDSPDVNSSYILRFNILKHYLPSPYSRWTGKQECRELSPPFGLQLGGCASNNYYFSGFSSLQLLIDTALIRMKTSVKDVSLPEISLQNFPKGTFTSDGTTVLRSIVPLYMVFAWAQFIIYMMMLVVDEKEKKIKEGMKMMGLRDSVYWLSWFSVYFMYVLLLAVICIIVLPLARVFVHANLFLLFLLFILYGSSSIVFALMLTPFFDKAKVAGVVGNLLQVAMSLLYYLQVFLEDDMGQGTFWALGLLSPCAFSLALDKVILFDSSSEGLNFSNVWEGPGLPFAGSLIMISIDICLYLFLAFYLDNVLPSEYGTKRKPWFIFEKSFWFPSHRNYQMSSLTSSNNLGFDTEEIEPNPDLEPVAKELKMKAAVRIRNLKKTFHPKGKDPVHAVDGISLDVYEGQITAILGHNGAGKTTLFNILTGMTAPTGGTASIFGMDISDPNDLVDIRRITGVCPQHDIIFLNLTPREHLSFYARIRGIPSNKVGETVEQTLKEVDLSSKGDTKAVELSGGQKRKLSIGIALIGDPKLVFLDEPTAGVDAYSRRKLWNLLKNRKEGKVILLTTHFMDEADILADRKAIVSKGKLRCCGSSLFLKNKFGLGYHLTLVVSDDCDTNNVQNIVQSVSSNAQLMRHYGKEMSFLLPSDSTESFPTLFLNLDTHMNAEEGNSAIEGYGISMTTLEEVFLTLSEENESTREQSLDDISQMVREKLTSSSPQHSASPVNSSAQNGQVADNNQQGFALDAVEVRPDPWRTYKAMIKVRFIGLLREKWAMFFLIVFPLGLTIGAIAVLDTQQVQAPIDELLNINTRIYREMSGALIQNNTTHTLTHLEGTLSSAGISSAPYDGNFSSIYNLRPHFTALDISHFPENKISDPASLNVRFNDSYVHAIPIMVNLLSNAILSTFGNLDQISVATHNLPSFQSLPSFDTSTFFAPMMIGFVYTLIPAALGIEIVNDREIGARNLLRLNGLSFNQYFSSFITVIATVFMLPYISLLIIIAAFGVPSLIIGPAFGAIALLYLLYIPVAFLYSSVFGYLFDRMETARQFYPNIATTVGFLSYTVVSIVDMVVGTQTDNNPAPIIHIILAILLPHYIPFGLLYYVNKIYLMCFIQNTCDGLTVSDYMTTEIIVLFVVVIVDIPFYYILLRIADTRKMGGNWRDALWMSKRETVDYRNLEETGIDAPAGEDDDVQEERNDVAAYLTNGGPAPPVLLYDLGKVYNKGAKNACGKKKEDKEFVAVKSVSLSVREGQVFGLLGPNGAGKTTTLRVLTAEEAPTKGRVQICGDDIQSGLSNVFQKLGYCAQHDVLWKNITVAEHIACYAEIRGVHPDQIQPLVDMYLKGLEIEEHRDKQSKDCSGGTKRKLSYIISMLGQPKVVLMDEPSTGMDPQSKRFLWNSILASFKGNRSAILTTHSMEEADALCSRIAIQVCGGLRCIGSVQHLKNKYGGGYTLEVKLEKQETCAVSLNGESPTHTSLDENVVTETKKIIMNSFPKAELDEEFGELLHYKIPQSDIKSLANSFAVLEKAKGDRLISEYALSQTTLEQVFLQFARQQEDDVEEGEEK